MNRWPEPQGGTLKQQQIQQLQIQMQQDRASAYNTIDESQAKEYEDPDFLYDHKTLNRRSHILPSSPSPPQPPPMALRGTLRPTHLAIHHQSESSSLCRNNVIVGMILAVILLLMFVALTLFLIMSTRAHNYYQQKERAEQSKDVYTYQPVEHEEVFRRSDMEMTPNHLLTLMMTKRKVCLFEAATDNSEDSLEQYTDDHIESARLLFHSNLSHIGVPVHPLQFQRYARSLGVDSDCHVVLYDRGHMVWATYAAWIFKLFGHSRVSLLSGGLVGWKAAQSRSPQYRSERGVPPAVARQGDFPSSWNESIVITFDDVFVNTEMSSFDVVDSQAREEFDGTATGALYGHIRGAVNVPVDTVFDFSSSRWLSSSEMASVFRRAGLSPTRPVIVYDSSSVRSSLLWWGLSRLGFHPRLYFGGWAEWVVRAPDYLKALAPST